MDKQTKLAVKVLEQQRTKFINSEDTYIVIWQTIDILAVYLGTESQSYLLIKSFTFGKSSPDEQKQKEEKIRFIECLDNAIDTIKKIGVIQKERNFINRISDKWLIPTVFFLLSGIFTASTLLAKKLSDTENIELKNQIKTLQDSLLTNHPCVPVNT
jgi:hypothetical protein